MKTIKVSWTEREIIEYGYEREIIVEEDFVINSEHIKDRVLTIIGRFGSFDSLSTNYEPIAKFANEDGDLSIDDFEIDSYEEILPPSPEDKRVEYLELLNEMDRKSAEIISEKERVLKLLNEL